MTDDEMYRKMELLHTEDKALGCYVEGHHDMDQFKRVAVDFLKTECDMTVSEQYRETRQGYHKVVPRMYRLPMLYFSVKKMRGSKPVMEMRYL